MFQVAFKRFGASGNVAGLGQDLAFGRNDDGQGKVAFAVELCGGGGIELLLGRGELVLGQPRVVEVRQHQLVYAALGDRMREEIHALSMKTLTPEEWQGGAG